MTWTRVRAVLERRNIGLLADVRTLIDLISAARVPSALSLYRDRIAELCHEQQVRIERNLQYLQLGTSSILPDILSDTNLAVDLVGFLSSQLATPVLRAKSSDFVCLWILGWLHTSHLQTGAYAPAMCDGDVAMLPLVDLVPVYFFPSIEQRGLLFQPLLFHEFGHLLYAKHKPELDDLVGELQREVEDTLLPASQRNDRYAQRQAARRRLIVRVWYRWAQELFCDAVGFDIGGPSFLLAFTTFLSRFDANDFSQSAEQMAGSHHPVTALRVHFLARRAEAAGFDELAARVRSEWESVAQALGVTTDFHGFYDDSLEEAVALLIEDMVTEVDPRRFSEDESCEGDAWRNFESPVALCAAAWQAYDSDPTTYATWETEQLRQLEARQLRS
ncbi:MAG: hypothetical protein IT305_19345 [Chloroflexi bacterium]|nr:hypothetical protein [Chloroflexota bacterium]